MASPSLTREVLFENEGFRMYGDGTFDRAGETFLPASYDPSTGVTSKDVHINPDVIARLYLPSTQTQKLPVLLYFHGGAFLCETPFSPRFHPYLNSLVSASNVLAVSVHYRLVTEHPIDACYGDCFAALQWATGSCPDPWLNERADLTRVYLMGDSAGANIAHHVAMRVGRSGGPPLEGGILVHPYFWGKQRLGTEVEGLAEAVEKIWAVACPKGSELGSDDPWINPVKAGGLEGLGCKRVLVCIAEKDVLMGRGKEYYGAVRGSGWGGQVELLESKGEHHVFHLFNPGCDNAKEVMGRVAAFLNGSGSGGLLL